MLGRADGALVGLVFSHYPLSKLIFFVLQQFTFWGRHMILGIKRVRPHVFGYGFQLAEMEAKPNIMYCMTSTRPTVITYSITR